MRGMCGIRLEVEAKEAVIALLVGSYFNATFKKFKATSTTAAKQADEQSPAETVMRLVKFRWLMPVPNEL